MDSDTQWVSYTEVFGVLNTVRWTGMNKSHTDYKHVEEIMSEMEQNLSEVEVVTPFILKFVEPIEIGTHAATTSNEWGQPADSADSDS